MTKKSLTLVIGGVLLAVLIFSFALGKFRAHHPRKDVLFVSTSIAQQRDVTVTTDVVGNAEAHATVAIKSLVDGHITKIAFKEGDFVKAGQPLIFIDPQPYIVKLNEAKALLASDQAKLTVAISAMERNSKLLPYGYISKQDFAQLQANTKSLDATVKSDQAGVTAAQLQLDYCTITAPISGRTGSLAATEGNLVKASDQNPLVIINQIAPIDVKFSVPEKQLFAIKDELSHGALIVQAFLAENPSVIKKGNVIFVDNAVDTQSGTITLKASFANEDQYFWPGQFVKLIVPLVIIPKAILIPTRAIQMGQNGAYVYVINAASQANNQVVVLGPTVGDETVVTQGLQANARVVTEGQSFITSGMKVKF